MSRLKEKWLWSFSDFFLLFVVALTSSLGGLFFLHFIEQHPALFLWEKDPFAPTFTFDAFFLVLIILSGLVALPYYKKIKQSVANQSPELFRWAGLSGLGLFYLFFLSEGKFFPSWDFQCYYSAAKMLCQNLNIYHTPTVNEFNASLSLPVTNYLYSPFLAAVLAIGERFSLRTVFYFFQLGHFWSILFSWMLLSNIAVRISEGNKKELLLSLLVCLLLFVINPPVIQTFIFNQVNTFTFLLILLTLYFAVRFPLFSACMLACATHLKLSPAIFLFLFLVLKRWKWLAYYFCWNLIILLAISSVFGFQCWFDFLEKLREAPTYLFRNQSIDSFLYYLFHVFGFQNPLWAKLCTAGSKCVILGIMLWKCFRLSQIHIDEEKKRYLLASIFFFLMIFLSPFIWWHHYVFWILPIYILFVLKKYAYFFLAWMIFLLVPMIEIFPVSYLKLYLMTGIFVFFFLNDPIKWPLPQNLSPFFSRDSTK